MTMTPYTHVSAIDNFAPTTLRQALAGTAIGSDIDDAWLLQNGVARISTPADYNADPATHVITPLQQPIYNAQTNLWDAFAVTQLSVASAAEVRCAAIDALLASKIAAGAHWNNILFQINNASQAKFAGAGAWAMGVINNVAGALPWPSGFAWIAADNSMVMMTAAQCYAFTQTMGAAVSELVLTARTIKNACLTAADLTDLNAIDITKNWPTV